MEIISWQSADFQSEQVKVNVLAQNNSAKEIQILMAKNSVMKEHKAPFAISVQVLRGEVKFSVFDEVATLRALDMVCLDALVPHSLHALKDSIVRLSLAKNDSIERVESVVKG